MRQLPGATITVLPTPEEHITIRDVIEQSFLDEGKIQDPDYFWNGFSVSPEAAARAATRAVFPTPGEPSSSTARLSCSARSVRAALRADVGAPKSNAAPPPAARPRHRGRHSRCSMEAGQHWQGPSGPAHDIE